MRLLIRPAGERWRSLMALTARLQLLVRANARIDTNTGNALTLANAAEFERELGQLERQIDDEIDTLTAEGLLADLRVQRRADEKKVKK